MSRNYDNWGRLVEAVMRREQFRQLSLASSITTSYDSDFSSSSSYRYDDSYFTPSPSHSHALSPEENAAIAREVPVPASKTRNIWRVFSIFKSNFYFKKVYRETAEKEFRWANSQRTVHGHEQMKTYSLKSDSQIAQETKNKKKTEFERLQELYTLKGHIEALVKAKGLDSDSVNHYYTI